MNFSDSCVLKLTVFLAASFDSSQGDWIKEGAVVVDCGINVIPGEEQRNLFFST